MNLFSDAAFRKIISISGINFMFRILGLVSSFLITILVSRLFGLGTWGNYSLIFTISQAAAMIFALGIPNAIIKATGEKGLTNNQAKTLLVQGIKVVLIVSVAPIFCIYFGASYLAVEIFRNAELVFFFKILGISLPFFILQEIFLYFFIAVKNFSRYNLFMFVLPNLLLVSFISLLYFLNLSDYWTFLSYAIAAAIIVLIEFIMIFDFKMHEPEYILSFKELLKIASPMMFSGLVMFLLNWTVIIMLGLMVDKSQIGIYNIAFRVGNVGFLIITSVSTIITPQIAELYGSGNMFQLKKLIHNSTRLIAVLSVPVFFFLVLFQNILLSFFGDEVITGGGGIAMTIISIGVLFSAMSGNVDQILNMTGNARFLKEITIVCFFINIVLNYFLIKNYGITGAAIASLITNIILNSLCIFFIKKKLGYFTLF